MTLSFIVPIYKTPEKCIRACISSILNTQISAIEVLCCFDGPGDDAKNYVLEVAAHDARIRVLVNDQNKGVAYSRNRCIKEATGKYVAFVDADDKIVGENYARAVEIAEREKLDCCALNIDYSGEDRCYCPIQDACLKISKNTKDDTWTQIVQNVGMSSCGVVFRRSVVIENGVKFPTGITNNEDFVFVTRFFSMAKRIGHCDLFGYKVIGQPLSATRAPIKSARLINCAKAGSLVLEASNADRNGTDLNRWYLRLVFREEIIQGPGLIVCRLLKGTDREVFLSYLCRALRLINSEFKADLTFVARIVIATILFAPSVFFFPPYLMVGMLKLLQKANWIVK